MPTEKALVSLYFALVSAFTVAGVCGACSHTPPVAALVTTPERDARAVQIEVMCVSENPFLTNQMPNISGGYGSGVILDSTHVLTAKHVTNCPYLADVHVVMPSGRRVAVKVDKEWADRDVVRLVGDFGSFKRLQIAPMPSMGENACTESAFPERTESCGPISVSEDAPVCPAASRGGVWCYDTRYGGVVVSGNSGSGFYNDKGALVGLTTGGAQILGIPVPDGFVTSLWAIRNEL